MTKDSRASLQVDSAETTEKWHKVKSDRKGEKMHGGGRRDRFVVKKEVKHQEIVLLLIPLRRPLFWVE